ncbi:MAG: hypothetical protein L0Y68_06395 [Candidatus Dadabacteria bacterium]|nr:hypothetical protein [Candidatus Dadabacteria bacterium]
MKSNKTSSPSEILVAEFLSKAKELQTNVELVRVLKARTYKIAEANVLIRAASEGNRRYFFGLNYLTVEEMANLDNPFIAFICGEVKRTIIIPAQLLFKHLSKISHDRNGEYKINIDKNLNIILTGRTNKLDCSQFTNSWNLLLKPFIFSEPKNTVEESLHSVLQGRLLEIGNSRGLKTFCPDKAKKFNGKNLSDITTLEKCPALQFANYEVLRKIDVLWFREKGRNLIPENAFEVELSTGAWSGVGRLATLIDYNNVGLYVISNDRKKYYQVMDSFADYADRFKHINTDFIGDLYSAELQLKELRFKIGL